MNTVKIITLHPIFNESAIILSKRLNLEIIKDFEPCKNEIYIVYGAHEKAIELLTYQKNSEYSYGYIILNSEQPSSNQLKNKYYIELMKKNIVFDYHCLCFVHPLSLFVIIYFYLLLMMLSLKLLLFYLIVVCLFVLSNN